MKKLLLPLLLLFAFAAQAQISKKQLFYHLAMQGGAPRVTQYPQDAPTFTAPQTRAAAGLTLAGSIFTADLSSRDVYLSGAFNGGAALNGILGTAGNPYRFRNLDGSTTIGTTSNATAAFGSVNVTNYVEFWGLNKNNPLKIFAGSGQSGIQMNPQVGGSVFRVYNVVGTDIGYSTLLYSAPSSGGSYYKKNSVAWLARSGLVTEGEHIYIGHVSTETIFGRNVLLHNSAIDMGRELIQIKWSEHSRVYNNTGKTIGQVADAAQQHAFQVEVSADTRLYDNIFDGAKRSVNIFSHDIIVKGGVIRWTSTAGYFGKASTFWPGNSKLNGQPVIFDGVTIIFDNAGTGYFAQWEETDCNLEFRNCRFSDNINSTIVQDIRGGSPTNSLIGTTTTNGNTVVAKATLLAEMPTYISEDETNVDFMNIPTSNYYFIAGAGKGTPTKRTIEILDAKEVAAETVVYATPFADVVKPSTQPVLLSSGYWVDANITWARGSYDSATAATYTIYGTPTGYSNTDNVKVEKEVTVSPYVNPNTARVNLAGTGGAYVSSGNWNNIFAAGFSTGAQTIKGDDSGSTLASLRTVGGTLTGYGVNIITGFDTGALGEDSGGGIFPNAAIVGSWANPGASGTSRSFTLTGLDNSKTYTIRTLSSVDVDITGSSHLVTIQVSGASGGSTVTDYEADGNKTVLNTFTGCVPTGNTITIRVEKRTAGQAVINAIEFEWN